MDREGVEPTHNAAERALRRGVIWRHPGYSCSIPIARRLVDYRATCFIPTERIP